MIHYINFENGRLIIISYNITDIPNKLKIPRSKITKTGIINSTVVAEEVFIDTLTVLSIETKVDTLIDYLSALSTDDIVYAVSEETKKAIVKYDLNNKYPFFKKFLPISVDFILSLIEELKSIDIKELTPFELERYIKASHSINPLLDFKNLFTYRDMPVGTYYAYSRKETAKKKDDDDSLDISKTRMVLGKKSSTNIYTVTKLATPDTRIDNLIKQFKENVKIDYYTILLLNKIVSNKGVFYTDNNQLNYVKDRPYRLETPAKDILVSELYPPSIAIYAFDKFREMDTLLTEVLDYPTTGEETVATKSTIDITDLIYNIDKKYTSKHNNDFTIMYNYNVNGKDYKIPIVSNLDIPSRNKLKRLEKYKPKVLLLALNESNVCLWVYSIIILNNGDATITANSPANLVLLEDK